MNKDYGIVSALHLGKDDSGQCGVVVSKESPNTEPYERREWHLPHSVESRTGQFMCMHTTLDALGNGKGKNMPIDRSEVIFTELIVYKSFKSKSKS